MHAIVTVLEPAYYRQVEAIWHDLVQGCGVSGVRITPIPHFSWQVAGAYRFDRVESVLRAVAAVTPPFPVETEGVGLFAAAAPVIFIKVRKTEPLTSLHARLWTALEPLRSQESAHYSPGQWVPHITLAERDVTPERLGCVMQRLSSHTLRWQLTASNLAVIEQPAGASGRVRFRTPLTGPGLR